MATNALALEHSMLHALLMPVRVLLTVALYGAGLLFTCWCIVLLCFFTTWKHDPAPLLTVFQHDVQMMTQDAPFSYQAEFAQTLSAGMDRMLSLALPAPGTPQPAARHDPTGSAVSRAFTSFFAWVTPAMSTVALATQWFAVRAALVAGMLPLIAVVYAVAAVDGMAQRAIRRAGAGRESASLYHRAKYMQYTLTGVMLITMLCVPVQVNPVVLMLLFGASLLPLTRLQWAFYKKYL
jgi:integrating conjugative element membrane protein (TIGR03747 family)